MMPMDEPYSVIYHGAPVEKASKALILLHGRGSTAQNILSLADRFCDDTFLVAAPQAPTKAWYPYSFMVEEKLNEPFLSDAVSNVYNIIENLSQHISPENIYLMGFSQGACLSLEVAARYPAKYGGVVAFSGGLIGKIIDPKKYQGKFKETKIFIGTSDNDPHVPLVRCEESKELLQKMGAHVTLMVYPGMPHTIIEEEIQWVSHNIF